MEDTKLGKRFNEGKAPLDQIPYEAEEAIAKVLLYGQTKYGKNNWRDGLPYSQLIGCAKRHIGKFNKGLDLDDESNLNHVYLAATNLVMLIWMIENRADLDDRWEKKQPEVATPKLTQMSFFVPNGMDLQEAIHKGEALCINSDYISDGDDCE
jgi:hypothetical protein